MNRRERRVAARENKKGPGSAGVQTAAALCEAGQRHMQAGRHRDAQLCCRQALAADPDHVGALHLMGLLSLLAGHYDDAIRWTARANEQDVNTDYLRSLAIVLEQRGLRNQALKAFERAVQLKPGDIELWVGHGTALTNMGRPEDALSSYREVLKLDPRHSDAAFRCGLLLITLKRLEEAISYFDQCSELHPNYAAVLQHRAGALHNLKRFEEALADNRREAALDPASPDICNNIGASLQGLRRDEEAILWFDKAIGMRPNFATALMNKASSLSQMRRIEEAASIYHHVKTFDPDNADAEWNMSFLHLLTGNFEAGWVEREVRWKTLMRPAHYPSFSQQMWLGRESLEGKTILVHSDEGLGDTIQFARYIPMLAARGGRVVLVVEEALYPLLSGLPGVVECLTIPAQSLPAFDLHCPIGSLPRAFGTRLDTIPSATSYLPILPQGRVQAWEKRLPEREAAGKKLRVGLVWSGNPNQANDHNRSIPLRMVSRLLDVGASFVSLQKNPRPEDQALLEQTDVIDLTSDFSDFAETAALVSCLDLVITVCTSVAHLAGALGRPTWILLPYFPDYRWLLDRDDSPWYPTARLFRQTETRDWGDVLHRVRSELARRIDSLGQP
jgi:tetratricopeptide (TPR) repeat protein